MPFRNVSLQTFAWSKIKKVLIFFNIRSTLLEGTVVNRACYNSLIGGLFEITSAVPLSINFSISSRLVFNPNGFWIVTQIENFI